MVARSEVQSWDLSRRTEEHHEECQHYTGSTSQDMNPRASEYEVTVLQTL
jgi:hypothetical protein